MRWFGCGALVVTGAVSACSSPLSPHEGRELALARNQWAQRASPDYTFEARHDCFCPPEQGRSGPYRRATGGD